MFLKAVGLIVEFNPFHYGHKYFIDSVKNSFKGYTVICVMSGNFTERGDTSVINKWDKTKIALDNGIDIVLELPFLYATQSADFFAYGALKILNDMGVSDIVFGSECNDISKLYDCAKKQLECDHIIKSNIKDGICYPKAVSNVYDDDINSPNDILGICYVKEIIKNNYNIKAHCIKRTNDYNSLVLDKICSSSAIRDGIKNNKDISSYIPYDISYINNKFLDDYFPLIKYQIICNDNLDDILGVDEGIENRLKKYIIECDSLNDFILKVKCKRYTYNRIKRILVHILCNVRKDSSREIDYIRVLGFSFNGQKYLSKLKLNIPILYNYKKGISKLFDIEYKSSCIYDYDLSKYEYKCGVIKK